MVVSISISMHLLGHVLLWSDVCQCMKRGWCAKTLRTNQQHIYQIVSITTFHTLTAHTLENLGRAYQVSAAIQIIAGRLTVGMCYTEHKISHTNFNMIFVILQFISCVFVPAATTRSKHDLFTHHGGCCCIGHRLRIRKQSDECWAVILLQHVHFPPYILSLLGLAIRHSVFRLPRVY